MQQKNSNSPSTCFFSCLVICLTVLLVNSCKKADTLVANSTKKEIIAETPENFFKLPANASPVLKRIAKELERQNKSKEFITAFIAKEGFPIWDKSRLVRHKQKGNTASFDPEGLEDTTVYIPLVVSADQYVTGFLKATVDDSVNIKIYRQNDYVNFPFKTPSSSTSVTSSEEYAVRMMAMDRDVFGSTEFKVKDKRMFNNSTDYSDTASIQRYLVLNDSSEKEGFADGTTINNYEYEICYTVRTRTNICNTFSGTSTNNTIDCYVDSYSNICFTYETGGESGGGSPGGGGSGSGGNNTWPFPPSGPGGGGIGCSEEFGATITNSFVPEECNPSGQNPWPSRDSHGYLYSRISDLYNKLTANPEALEPCDSLNIMPLNPHGFGTMWQDIAQYELPGALQDRIDSVNNLFTSSSYDPPLPMYQQTLSAAAGTIVNCDFFPVKIIQLPTGYTAQSLLEYFRKNINTFAQPSNTFEPYSYVLGGFGPSIYDSAKFNTSYQNSLGALVHIGITLNDGTVIESKYENYNSPPYNHESHQVMFSTLRSPLDFTHPVGGNRAFGIYNSTGNPTEYTFYTMGVDRVWHDIDVLLGIENTIFHGGDQLWTNMQSNMISFINSLPGGQASAFATPKIIARPKWDDVDDFLLGTITWAQLKTAMGC